MCEYEDDKNIEIIRNMIINQQKEIEKCKNIAESEKAIHTDLKRQRDELEKIRVGLIKDKRELEKEIKCLKEKLFQKNSLVVIDRINEKIDEIDNGYIPKSKIEELKKFYINEYNNRNLEFIPLSNLIKNINKLLESEN